MIKKMFNIFKKVIYAVVIIYSLDLILKGFDIVVPLNIYTISVVTVLGFPGLIMLALSFFFLL